MALEPSKETITSALGPKGPAIQEIALRLVAVLEASIDLEVTSKAWSLADTIYGARLDAARLHGSRIFTPIQS